VNIICELVARRQTQERTPGAVRHEREISNAGSKNWILPKEVNENRFFLDSHWLEIWKNHFCRSMEPNGGRVAMDSVSKCGDNPSRELTQFAWL
jgi:hypothetical protein